MARAMVTQYGMTERLGAIKFGWDNAEPFLGRDMAHQRDYSEEVAGVVDEEVKKLIETAHNEAWEILVENRDILDDLVLELLEKETLDKAQIAEVFAHIRKRPARPAWTGSDQAQPAGRSGDDPQGARRPRQRQQRAGQGAQHRVPDGSDRPSPDSAACRPTTSRDGRWGSRADRRWSTRTRPVRGRESRRRPGRAVRAAQCASCWSPSARTRTATGCGTPPTGWPGPTGDLRRAVAGARGRPDHHLRPRPRRDGARQGHRGAESPASTTWCRSSASRTSATSRPRTAGSPGLSKLARLVDVFARRPQVQERLTTQIADSLMRDPGAARRDRRRRVRAPVHVDARHPQAGREDDHVGGARPAARPRDPGRGDEPHRRAR